MALKRPELEGRAHSGLSPGLGSKVALESGEGQDPHVLFDFR